MWKPDGLCGVRSVTSCQDKDWKLVYFVQSVIRDGPQRAWSDEEVKVVLEEYYGVTPRA